MPDRRGQAALFVVGAGAAFATSGPLAWYAQPAHPLVIVLGRVLGAALVLAAVDARGLWRELARMAPRQRLGVALAGLLLAAHFILFVWGLQRTSLPAAVSLVSLEPLSVVLLAWLLQGIRPAPLEQLGVVLATSGALLIARGAGTGAHRLGGDLLVLVAVVLYGLYITAARAWRGALPPTRYAAMVYGVAALASAALLPLLPPGGAALPPHALWAIAALAIVPTLFGHTLVQAAAKVMSPSIVALVSPGETVGGLLIAAFVFGARPQPVEIAGAAVVVAGATVAILAPRRAAA